MASDAALIIPLQRSKHPARCFKGDAENGGGKGRLSQSRGEREMAGVESERVKTKSRQRKQDQTSEESAKNQLNVILLRDMHMEPGLPTEDKVTRLAEKKAKHAICLICLGRNILSPGNKQ